MIGVQAATLRTRRFLLPLFFATMAVGLVVFAPAPGAAQQATAQQGAAQEVANPDDPGEPRVLELEDYPRWSRIGNVGLSPDGVW